MSRLSYREVVIRLPGIRRFMHTMPYYIPVFLFLFLAVPAAGQPAPADSSFSGAARRQAIMAYEQSLLGQAHIFEGNEYIAHDHRIKVHPYYKTDSLQAGTIRYNGVIYHNVGMLYDIVRGELAIQPPGGGFRLRVRNEYVGDFSLGSHQFSRIVSDSISAVPTDFYEVLYNGRTSALAHRIKTVHEDISSGVYRGEYLQKDRFYILKQGLYREVKSKHSVLKLFPEQAKLLRKYIRAANLKFNDNQREEAVTLVTRRYDELTR